MSKRQCVPHDTQDDTQNHAEAKNPQICRMISTDDPIRIIDLDFSVPVYNALTRVGIVTLGDLLRSGMDLLAQKISETRYQNQWQQIRYEVQSILARLDLLL